MATGNRLTILVFIMAVCSFRCSEPSNKKSNRAGPDDTAVGDSEDEQDDSLPTDIDADSDSGADTDSDAVTEPDTDSDTDVGEDACRQYWGQADPHTPDENYVNPCLEPEATPECLFFVDADMPAASGDGLSWDTAFSTVQKGIDAAHGVVGAYWDSTDGGVPGGGPACSVWVAMGIYPPHYSNTVQLKPGVCLYGGFLGDESDLGARDYEKNETLLDGNRSVEHVVEGSDYSSIDGFKVTGGIAMRPDPKSDYLFDPNNYGGGMLNTGCSPLISNCIFAENSAAFYGGGMANIEGASPRINNCAFKNNRTDSFFLGYKTRGGGMYNLDSAPVITNCVFEGNIATHIGGFGICCNEGGAIFNGTSSPTISGCVFNGNHADIGGAISNNYSSSPKIIDSLFVNNVGSISGGGLANTHYSSPTLTNSIFEGNSAGAVDSIRTCGEETSTNHGASMTNFCNSSPVVTHCTFNDTGATSSDEGGSVANFFGSSPTITNSILVGASSDIISNCDESYIQDGITTWSDSFDGFSEPNVTYSNIQGGHPGVGNIDEDSLFAENSVDVGPRDIVTGRHLQAGSPCIDTGTNSAVNTETDFDGNPRITNSTTDMGAFEYQGRGNGGQ